MEIIALSSLWRLFSLHLGSWHLAAGLMVIQHSLLNFLQATMQSKLPISRIQRERSESGGRRIGRACNPCRERKTKCDGKKPTCSQCRGLGVANCFYPESIVIRQQQELELVRGQSERYEALLRNISKELEGPIAKRIAKVLKVSLVNHGN